MCGNPTARHIQIMADPNSQSIFVSTACLPGVEPIASRISLYQSYGLNAIELGAGVSVDKDSLSKLVDLKCQFLVHNYFPQPSEPFVLNLASNDGGILRRSLALVSEALTLTARLDVAFYSIHAGFVTDPTNSGDTGFVFPPPASPDETQLAMGRFIKALEIPIEYANHIGVGLLVENNVCSPERRGKLLLQTAEEFLALFRALPSPHVGILLDTGHLNVTARTFGFDRMAFIAQVAPYVRAFHVHDNDGITDTHQPVQHGSWVLDVLGRQEFSGLPIVVEAKFDDAANIRRHIDWLKEKLQH